LIPLSRKDIDAPLPWLFSPAWDLGAFGGSALAALAVALWAWSTGRAEAETSPWGWVATVLLVDVAHVHLTWFRTHLDPAERAARPWLTWGVPLACAVLAVLTARLGEAVFWRALAYVAVFHFVRQQWGWVALYRAREGDRGAAGLWIDRAAIYLATLHPLVWWHAHLPRRFHWFVDGDFAALPPWAPSITAPLWAMALVAYALRALTRGLRDGRWNPGKDLVVASTAACWYVGIVVFDGDLVFTVTNVLIHGVPYFAVVWRDGARRYVTRGGGARVFAMGAWALLGAAWVIAYAEELLWDRAVWQERPWLFGEGWSLSPWRGWIVPLLAAPQLTHYVLDGFIWKRRDTQAIRDGSAR
jgi:hypothetical protein